MGTRADFYVGRGKDAEWLGSIAWDGYPQGIAKALLKSKDEAEYRGALTAFFAKREDVTLPERGWPWPWENSQTTDYAYAFDGGKVWASRFGHKWFRAAGKEPQDHHDGAKVEFPDMSTRTAAPAGDKRSGIMLIQL